MGLLTLVDPSIKSKINEETGEYLLSGTGALHLEIAVKDLQDMQNIELKDCNNKEIFDGDILTDEQGFFGFVMYINGGYKLVPHFPHADGNIFDLEEIEYHDLDQEMLIDNELVILGNIYENYDDLKQAETTFYSNYWKSESIAA